MNRLDRNPNDPPTPREILWRRIGMVSMWLTTLALIVAVVWLGAARWTVYTGSPGTETLRVIGLSLISFAVLMISFVAIVLATTLNNVPICRFATVVAVLATISAAASLLGF